MEVVNVLNAPQAIGPYSQAVKAGGFLFCSGQIPLTAEGVVVEGDAVAQARQVLTNLRNLVEGAGSSLEKVVKCTMFLADMNDFAAVNEVYGEFFDGEVKPARSTVQVARLPKDAKVEVECIAVL